MNSRLLGDTSSISHLVFAAQLLKGLSYDGELAQVRTFRSYEGIDVHSFSRDRREVGLVSASESGTMAAALAGKVRERRDVLTIFSTADAPEGTAVLCDLRFDETLNPSGFSPPEGEGASPLRASRPIRLLGEHFVAEAMPASAVTPLKADAPDSVAVLAKVKGGGVFSMLRSNPADDGKAPWVNVEALLRTAHGERWLREKACAVIPVTTKALVLADDHQDTQALADALVAEVELQTGRKPDWDILSHTSIESGCGNWTGNNPTAPVLVISGATGHGRELLSVSRALRDYAPKSVRIFLTTIVSAASAEAVDKVRDRSLGFMIVWAAVQVITHANRHAPI